MNESKSLTGGQAAIKSLKKEKVKHVFGLIGSATMEMFDALYHEKNIKFICDLVNGVFPWPKISYAKTVLLNELICGSQIL